MVMTGPQDFISDGHCVVTLSNGHDFLGKITGSGCIVGSCIAAYCAGAATEAQSAEVPSSVMVDGDMLLAAVTGFVFLLPIKCY